MVKHRKSSCGRSIKGVSYSEGLIQVYRRMNPQKVSSAGGFKSGNRVAYKKSKRTHERAWNKIAGNIMEIRKGRSGPLLVSSTGIGKPPVMSHIGPVTSVALIKADDGSLHFSEVRDLKKVSC